MDEFDVIERYFARTGQSDDRLALGIGDDGAVMNLDGVEQLVIATDTVNVGTHFPETMPAQAVGHRCLAVNLSDLAAMGAEPLWCTLALSMPTAKATWLEQFSRGFFALADRSGVALIGGDTVRGPLAVTVTVHGRVPRDQYVARSGARSGDDVYVTGTPGDAAAGLQRFDAPTDSSTADVLRHRFCYPEPRLSAGVALRGIATAMIDVSDGLHVDLCRLANASGVGAQLQVDALPLSDAALDVVGTEHARQNALTGGDDYELCFTAPPEQAGCITDRAGDWSFRVTRLGTVVQQAGINWLHDDAPYAFDPGGFVHFNDDRRDA